MIIIYTLFGLLSLNLVGADPADFIIIITACFLLIKNTDTLILSKITAPARIALFTLAGFMLISIYIGYDFRFVGAYFVNFLLFLIIYYITLCMPIDFQIGRSIFIPFLILNILFFVLGSANVEINANLFEVFRDGRYLGSMGDPNFTGFFAVLCTLYFLETLVYSQKNRTNALLFVLSLLILLLSESRAAWAAAAVSLAVYFSLMRGRRYKLAVPAISTIAIVGATFIVGSTLGAGQFGDVASRVETIFVQTDSAEAERFQFVYTRESLLIGIDHPLGVGPGNTFSFTGLVNADGKPIGAHNAFVQIFAENGWGALLCLLALLCAAVPKLLRRAAAGWTLNDVSCRVILSMVSAQIVFAMAHDMIAWRVAWVVPSLAVCAAFARASGQEASNHKVKETMPPDLAPKQQLTSEFYA